MLSGFVFAPYFFGQKIQIGSYFVRRFFRIYPLYALALLFYTLLRWDQENSIGYLIKHIFFLHTIESPEIAFHFNPAFWSLPPEIEFYFILPILGLLAGNIFRVVAITFSALVLHLIVVRHAPLYPAINLASIFSFHLPGLLIEFMLGTIAWRVACHPIKKHIRICIVLVGLGLWLALATTFSLIGNTGIDAIDWLKGNIGLGAAFAFAFIVTAWSGWIDPPPRWLVMFSVSLGNLSYGTYLFHNAIPQILGEYKTTIPGPLFALLCLLATLCVAQILHWAWEAPCRRFGRNLAAGKIHPELKTG